MKIINYLYIFCVYFFRLSSKILSLISTKVCTIAFNRKVNGMPITDNTNIRTFFSAKPMKANTTSTITIQIHTIKFKTVIFLLEKLI